MSIETTGNPLPLKLQRDLATFLDLNPRMGKNHYPELIIDELAIIEGSIANLILCYVGDRGRIFQPEYGTHAFSIIGEPLDDITAYKLRALLIQGIQKWEPRIETLQEGTFIEPDASIPGYQITLNFVMQVTRRQGTVQYTLPVSGR